MSRWRAIAVALIALAGAWPAATFGANPVGLTAGFDPGARLGAATALNVALRIDPRRAPSPVTEVRLLFPNGLGVLTSGLGLATCSRPAVDFQQVIISGPKLGGCSPNAVLGYGTAVAEVRIVDGQVIPELATFTVLAGPIEHGTLGVVVYVDGQTPFGAKLAYAGSITVGSGPFGGALAIRLPAIPALDGFATVALVSMHLSIGSRAITYYEHVGGRRVAYHPDGITLPDRCPSRGFRFRAQLALQDGGHATATTAVRCTRLASPAAR